MKNKYHAIKSAGYDSRKEHKRAIELKLLEKAGIISDLQEQVKFTLLQSFKDNQGNHEREIAYIADFVYYDNEKKTKVVEDVKSAFTKKLPVYVIKRKMFKKFNPHYLFLET